MDKEDSPPDASNKLVADPLEPPSNDELAEQLELVSDLLAAQGADRFRAEAYRRAAEAIRRLATPVWQLAAAGGLAGLESIKQVGPSIARALQHLLQGSRWPLLERLLGNDVAERSFASVPNIGPKLAKRLHEELGIETLAELEAAAWDGRLQKLEGFGEKRVRAVRESLASRGRWMGKYAEEQSTVQENDQSDVTDSVPVSVLLDIDREYLPRASRDDLPRIAPRRLNPAAEAWLPVMHTERQGRHYTALYSNTERAHAMHTTHDWVVIYLEDHGPGGEHGRWTVITSRFGRMKGNRIVRGREEDCLDYYRSQGLDL